VVPPHDKGIVTEVNAVPLPRSAASSTKSTGRRHDLGASADEAYLAVAAKAAIDPACFRARS
jgi:phosphoglucomutase